MNTKHTRSLLAAVAVGIAAAAAGRAQTHDGYNLPPDWGPPVLDSTTNYLVLFEKLEFRTGQAEDAAVLDAQGWIGGDYNRLWWKAESEQETRSPKAGEFQVQALYGRLIHPYWDVQAGFRFDRRYSGPKRDSRGHLAIGLQGVAPYWFELEPTLFVSDDGDVTFGVEASYEQLITQRLVIEPRIDLAAAFQDDRSAGTGAGLTDVEFGLRLRYEFNRQFAPYVGVTWTRVLGASAGIRRQMGERTSVSAIVMGIRSWF